jgi:hypothetical protein
VIAGEAVIQLFKAFLLDRFDWTYPGVWAAVDEFARVESDLAQDFRGEVELLLQPDVSETELRALIVDELKSGYNAAAEGWTYRAWLAVVADRVDHVLRFPEQVPDEPMASQQQAAPKALPVKAPRLKGTSSFPDRQIAESSVAAALQANEDQITQWLSSTSSGLRLAHEFSYPVGRMAIAATGEVIDARSVAVILRRSKAMPGGYRVHNAYPATLSNAQSSVGHPEALAKFLGVYLHQDWNDDYPSVWAAIADFVASDHDIAMGLHADISELIHAVSLSESSLRSVVIDDLDCWYLPESQGWTYRAWLDAVDARTIELR